MAVPRLALLLLPAVVSCSPGDDPWRATVRKRAEALRYLALPIVADKPGPSGTFINTLVSSILVVTSPAGATVILRDRPLGPSPREIPSPDLAAADSKGIADPCPLRFEIHGAAAEIKAYRLRDEAANVGVGISPEELPRELRARDHYLYVELADPRGPASRAPR